MGAKIKTQKFPESITWYNTKNKFLKTSLDVLYLLKYAGTTTNLLIVFNTQNNTYLNQDTQTKYSWQNFLLKKILEWKILNPNNPLIIPVTWDPEWDSNGQDSTWILANFLPGYSIKHLQVFLLSTAWNVTLLWGHHSPSPSPWQYLVYVMEERHSEVKMAFRLEPQLYSDQKF